MRLRRETGDYSLKVTHSTEEGFGAGKINKGLKAEDLIGAVGTLADADEDTVTYFIVTGTADGVNGVTEDPEVTMTLTGVTGIDGLIYDVKTGTITVDAS